MLSLDPYLASTSNSKTKPNHTHFQNLPSRQVAQQLATNCCMEPVYATFFFYQFDNQFNLF